MIREVTLNDEYYEMLKNLVKTSFSYNLDDDFRDNVFTKYFIYVQKSNIIGYVNYYDLYDRFELSYIYVVEDMRNHGIASKMLEHLIDVGKNKNIDNITLEVSNQNMDAIKLYTKYEFKEVAIRTNYYDGNDGILMERKMK